MSSHLRNMFRWSHLGSNNIVELWIEVGIRGGHAEIRVDLTSYGFWPDWERSAMISGSRAKDSSPIYGGYRGKVRIQSLDEFAHYYESIRYDERELGELAPLFHVYPVRVSPQEHDALVALLRRAHQEPPEYAVRARGNSHNCVTFAIDAFWKIGIMDKNSHFMLDVIHPKRADLLLTKIAGSGRIGKRREVTIRPAKFSRRIG